MAKAKVDGTNEVALTPGADGHSPNFAKVKRYYDKKLWTLHMVWMAVGRWITEAEYTEITGYIYPAPER